MFFSFFILVGENHNRAEPILVIFAFAKLSNGFPAGVLEFASNQSGFRNLDAKKLIALAIFAGAGLEKPLKIDGNLLRSKGIGFCLMARFIIWMSCD